MWKELEYYKEYQKRLRAFLGDWKAIRTISNSLYIISIGTNDFLENYYAFNSQRRTQYTVDAYQQFLLELARKFVVDLHGLGARKISLGGLPPMGCMPLERAQNFVNGNGCMETYNIVAMSFNTKLYNLVRQLNKEIPGLKLVFSNPYYILLQIIQNPSAYGKFFFVWGESYNCICYAYYVDHVRPGWTHMIFIPFLNYNFDEISKNCTICIYMGVMVCVQDLMFLRGHAAPRGCSRWGMRASVASSHARTQTDTCSGTRSTHRSKPIKWSRIIL